jgi:plastocyanin
MNIRNVNNSTVAMAGIAGLLFTLVYGGFEFSQGIPERIAIGGDTNAISVFHFPLIWLVSGVMLYSAFYAIGAMRGRKVKEGPIAFGLSIAVAVLIAWYWALPMLSRLTKIIAPNQTNLCAEPFIDATMTRSVTVHYSEGFCPVEVKIKKGATVRFVAAEGISMRITSDYAPFNQKEAAGEYAFTFTEVGIYSYYDSPSPTDPFWKFISEFLGKTQVFQGTVNVTE